MVDAGNILSTVERVVPKIKTLLQLSGLVAGLAVFVIANSRGSSTGQLIAGFIGISVISFTLAFNVVPLLPEGSRARFILSLYGVFLIAVLILTIAAYLFLSHDTQVAWRQETRDRVLQFQAEAKMKLADAQAKAAQASERLDNANSKAATAAIRAQEVAAKLAADQAFEAARRDFKFANSLLEDINSPNSKVMDIVRRLDSPQGSFHWPSIISTAKAEGLSEFRKDLIAASSGKLPYEGWLNQIDGHIELARAQLETARQTDPTNPAAIEALANFRATMGEYSQAAHEYDELIDVLGQHSEPGAAMLRALAQKDRATVERFIPAGGDPDPYYIRALATYEETSKSARDPVVLANIQNEYGQFLAAAGKRQAAKRQFDEALVYFSQPNSDKYGYPHLLTSVGQFDVSECRFSEGVNLLSQSIDVQERTLGTGTQINVVTLEDWGNALVEMGRYDEAVIKLAGAADMIGRLEPASDRRANVNFDLGRAQYLRNHGPPDAERAMSAALVELDRLIGPDKPWSTNRRYLMVRELRLSGDVDKARQMIEKVTANAGANPTSMLDLLIERFVLGALEHPAVSESELADFVRDTTPTTDTAQLSVTQNIRVLLAKSLVDSSNWHEESRSTSYCEAVALARLDCPGSVQIQRDLEFARSRLAGAPSCRQS